MLNYTASFFTQDYTVEYSAVNNMHVSVRFNISNVVANSVLLTNA